MEPRISKTAGGIVLGDKGTIAMVRRRGGDGAWLFPKGHLDEGEDAETAARREIKEETGLGNLELLDDLGTYERYGINADGTENKNELKEIHMFLFADMRSQSLNPSLEIEEAKWVSHREVPALIGSIKDSAWFASVFKRVRAGIQKD